MLTKQERFIAGKAFIEGYAPKEIADMTGVSERWIQQILKDLRKKFEKI